MSNWISVETELPELGARVLIYWRPVDWEKRPYHREIMAAGYSNSDRDDEPYFWVMRKYDTATYVTHWMPLPEPPNNEL